MELQTKIADHLRNRYQACPRNDIAIRQLHNQIWLSVVGDDFISDQRIGIVFFNTNEVVMTDDTTKNTISICFADPSVFDKLDEFILAVVNNYEPDEEMTQWWD